MESGILLVDKPDGITSHTAVARVRKMLGTRKVGHAGTLDPAATGLLVLGINRGTKLLHFITGLDKSYLATIRLGASTVTDDAEGDQLTDAGVGALQAEEIEAVMRKLRGNIMQSPSAVSAIKIDGQRAHRLARAGHDVKIPSRPVKVSRFDVVNEPARVGRYLDIDVAVDCSSGTYVRSLARDLGATLGVGGHLTSLRRTAVGPWLVEEAAELNADAELGAILPLGDVCKLLYPPHFVTESECLGVRYGNPPEAVGVTAPQGSIFTLTCPGGEAIGLGELKAGRLRPVFIINPV